MPLPPAPPLAPGMTVPQGTNGLAIAGFVLAFLVAPLGLILSIVAMVKVGRSRQKGKGLAIAGLVISLVLTGVGVSSTIAVATRVKTLVDPGCTVGKSAIFDNQDAVSSSDPDTFEAGVLKMVDGLNDAASQAKDDKVRAADKDLAADYSALVADVKAGRGPTQQEKDKLTADSDTFDSYCSVSTK
ncbi:DUF4190 domain-containing protein [Rugosimonospora acidiphila]